MSMKRASTFILAVLVSLTTLTCTDTSDPLTSVEPQFIKGGIPAKPADPEPVELLEFYIYENTSGENFIHILAKGTFPRVNLNVVQDYHFDGIRNNDLYYEYTTAAPAPVGADDLPPDAWAEVAPETWHIDIPFDGKGGYYPEGSTVKEYMEFPDYPHIGLNGTSADPYTFDIRFQMEDGEYIDSYRPKGIILDGAEIGSASDDIDPGDLYHSGKTVHSYATHASTRTDNHGVSIRDIILDETSFSCDVKKVRTGTGRDKVTQIVTEVSTGAQVILGPGAAGDPVAPGWITVMFATGDPESPTLHDTFATTHGSDAWAEGWGAGAQIPGDVSAEEIRFAVVYVWAKDFEYGDVYQPALNADLADPSFSGNWFTINPTLNSYGPNGVEVEPFPVVLTAPMNLDCGN